MKSGWVAIVFVGATLLGARPAGATTAVEPMLRSMDKLLAAEARAFTGIPATEVRALRKDFTDKLAAASAAAKGEYARLAAGKTTAEIDQTLWARSARAGMPAEAKNHVEAAGGPAKTMQQLDRISADFAANVLEGSRQFAQDGFGRIVQSMIGAAHARLLKRYCYLAVYSLTVGSGSAANYDTCNRNR